MTAPQLTEVVGVYDADGGLLGELRYVLGKAPHRLPLVLARLDDARLVVLVEAEPLDCLGGSVAGFEQAVRDGFVRHGWQLPAAP